MTLSALTFVRMADVVPAGALVSDILDAIYTALTAATDYRGIAVPATHAWQVTRKRPTIVTEAVVALAPVGTTMGLNPALIYAGRIANAGTMCAPDTSVASMLQAGIVKNAGAYLDWTSPTPMTSGQFSGYWRMCPVAYNAGTSAVRMYVSQETIKAVIVASTTAASWHSMGARIQPYSTDLVTAAETDGRLYGMCTSGGNGAMATLWANSVGTQWSGYSATPGAIHSMVFQPGTANVWNIGPQTMFCNPGTTAETQDPAAWYISGGIPVCRATAAAVYDGQALGVCRGVGRAGLLQSGQYIRNGATDLFHIVSTTTVAATSDGLMLAASP